MPSVPACTCTEPVFSNRPSPKLLEVEMVCALDEVLLGVPALRSVRLPPPAADTTEVLTPASTSEAPAWLTSVGVPAKDRPSSPVIVIVPLFCQLRSPSRRRRPPTAVKPTVVAPCVRSTPVPATPAESPPVTKAPVTVTVPEPARVAFCRLRLLSVMSLFRPSVPAVNARSPVPSDSSRPGEPRFSVPPVSS